MSNVFNIKSRADGSYARDENNRVLVKGTEAGEMAWLSHTQLDSIAKAEAIIAGQSRVAAVIDAEIAADPVQIAIEAEKAELERVTDTGQIPEEFRRKDLEPATAGVPGVRGKSVDFNHDSQVILLIEAERYDNLEWDVSQSGSQRIAILF